MHNIVFSHNIVELSSLSLIWAFMVHCKKTVTRVVIRPFDVASPAQASQHQKHPGTRSWCQAVKHSTHLATKAFNFAHPKLLIMQFSAARTLLGVLLLLRNLHIVLTVWGGPVLFISIDEALERKSKALMGSIGHQWQLNGFVQKQLAPAQVKQISTEPASDQSVNLPI